MESCLNKSIIVLLFLSLPPSILSAKEPLRTIEGIVTKVTDGDTIHVKDSQDTKLKIRLYGIDAPEIEKKNKKTGIVSKPGQPWGNEAWKALEKKVLHRQVKLDVLDIDKYKRLVCIVRLDGRNINQEMIREGHAWAYRKYLDKSPYASEFFREEEGAREEKLGIWKEVNPQPPWEFRMTLKNLKMIEKISIQEMLSMNEELEKFNAEARELEEVIGKNIRALSGGIICILNFKLSAFSLTFCR